MQLKFNASELNSIYAKIDSYVKEGNSYVLEIKKAKDKRSLNQNKYYWGVVITLFSQQTGYTSNEAHQTLAQMHLMYLKERKEDAPIMFTRSTTELMWHEFNIKVPLPNEVSEEFLMQMSNIYNY